MIVGSKKANPKRQFPHIRFHNLKVESKKNADYNYMVVAIGNLSETMVTAIIRATTVQQRWWTISIAEEKNTRKAKRGSC